MMAVFSVGSSWFDFPMLFLCNFKNNWRGGFAIKIFGFCGSQLSAAFVPP